jgi:hypothetical protein
MPRLRPAWRPRLRVLGSVALALAAAAQAQAPAYFGVEVVDEATGRGVPLIELRTVNDVRYYTDSQGWAALQEPELAGEDVWFHVRGHGYEHAADGFGMRGVRLRVEPGKTARVKVRRVNLAERLYRITGEGIYRDSRLLGRPTPAGGGARILGCDSVQNTVYRGRLFWLWGDTSRASYPLGNFHMSGATSALPAPDPERGLALEYFTAPDGFAREMARMPGDGPTWLGALTVLRENGEERLFAAYAKIKPPLTVYARGLCVFDDAAGRFVPDRTFAVDAPVIPHGHPVRRATAAGDHVYFGDPFPLVRVAADPAAFRDLTRYEAYTCLKEGTTLAAGEVDRDADGRARYAWRRGTPAVPPEEQERLIRAGKLRREEALFRFVDGGKPVVIHRGTVHWNGYRKRWVMIATQIGGTSLLGEVWYAECDSPQGPWLTARKVVTHERYSFYNPAHHPEFDRDGGRVIHFEGTYTHTFSGNTEPTPRYDYNQVLYRLDLADPRLR